MTPHFLEIIACACHVIARYPSGRDGVDAQYYEFNKFSPSVETYEEFESSMDEYLKAVKSAENKAAAQARKPLDQFAEVAAQIAKITL